MSSGGRAPWNTGGVTPSHPPVVAAFDLDGTLTNGGSVFAWLRYLCGARATYAAALNVSGPLAEGAVRSGAAADEAKQRLFRLLLAGRDLVEVTEASRVFARSHLERHGRPRILARLGEHLTLGHDVVIVSASPELYAQVVALDLGASRALATRLAVDGRGALTGDYDGPNCRGEEKLRRLNEWIGGRGFDTAPSVYAYGNSRGDRRLLAFANYPYDVGRLGAVGALRHFPRLAQGPLAPTPGG